MKILRRLSLVLAISLSLPAFARALDRAITLPLDVGAAELTESAVLVSSLTNTGSVLAANADRVAFDVQVTTCPSGATKVWYSFDTTGVSTVTASASNVIFMPTGTYWSGDTFVRQPHGIVHQGPVYMRAEITGCYAAVREWTTTSPIFR